MPSGCSRPPRASSDETLRGTTASSDETQGNDSRPPKAAGLFLHGRVALVLELLRKPNTTWAARPLARFVRCRPPRRVREQSRSLHAQQRNSGLRTRSCALRSCKRSAARGAPPAARGRRSWDPLSCVFKRKGRKQTFPDKKQRFSRTRSQDGASRRSQHGARGACHRRVGRIRHRLGRRVLEHADGKGAICLQAHEQLILARAHAEHL